MTTFCSTSAWILSSPSSSGWSTSTTLRAAWALRSQERTVGILSRASSQRIRPAMAPQLEWPQTTMSVTPSATTAYSTTADTPPIISP